jgi:hypothetical protein
MTTPVTATGSGARLHARRMARTGQPPASIGFDMVMALLLAWPIFGAYLDAWAHNHGLVDSFFTPWHAVLYSGFVAVVFALYGTAIWNHSRGYAWLRSLPPGYELSALAIPFFAIGGVGDMLWHMAFGIEKQLDGIFSPTHMALTVAMGVMATGPLRSCWRRRERATGPTWHAGIPVIASLTILFALFTAVTQYAHPAVNPVALAMVPGGNQFFIKAYGALSIFLQTGIFMGLMLLAMRRWRLLPGAFTVVLSVPAVLASFLQDHFALIPVAVVAGIVADVLYQQLRPSGARTTTLRLFAFLVPFTYCLLYFLTLDLIGGIWWTIHMWLGVTVLSGIIGWLMSYLVAPPALPAEPQATP